MKPQPSAKSAAELQQRLDEAVAERDVARADVEALTGARAYLIRREASDSELDAHEKKITSASRRAERAAVRIELLSADVATATAAEASARQAERECEAEDAAKKATQLLTDTFEHFTPILQKALRAMFEADKLVKSANQTRSAELEPLPTVEQRARLREPLPREIVSSEQVELWAHPDENRPLTDEQQKQVSVEASSGKGHLYSQHTGPHYLEKKVSLRQVFLPALRFPAPDRLVAALCIPPLRAGDPDGWRPIEGYYNPTEDTLLARLNELQSDSKATAADPRKPEVEFVLLGTRAAAA